jgi:hypothetical protein
VDGGFRERTGEEAAAAVRPSRGTYVSAEGAMYAALRKLGHDRMFQVAPCKVDCSCGECVEDLIREALDAA